MVNIICIGYIQKAAFFPNKIEKLLKSFKVSKNGLVYCSDAAKNK